MENKTLKDIHNFINENKEIFTHKVKNKLKSGHKLSDNDAKKIIDDNSEDIEKSYNDKENPIKTSTKLATKVKK